jgi:hypothetical protein
MTNDASNSKEDDSEDEADNPGLSDLEDEDIFDINVISTDKGEGSCQLFKVGDKYIAVHQHLHYLYRGIHFEKYNFLEYCAIVSIGLKGNSGLKTGLQNVDIQEHYQYDTQIQHKGRKENGSFDFNTNHPLYNTYTQYLRSKIRIPTIEATSK